MNSSLYATQMSRPRQGYFVAALTFSLHTALKRSKIPSHNGYYYLAGKLLSANHADIYSEWFRPDLAFRDILKGKAFFGLEASKALQEKFSDVKIIIMAGFDEVTCSPKAPAGIQ